MPLTQPQKTNFKQSLITLGAATDLAAKVIKNIAGNDISNAINGEVVSMTTLRTLVQSRLKQQLDKSDHSGII